MLRRYAQTDPRTGYFTVLPVTPFAVWPVPAIVKPLSILDISGFRAIFGAYTTITPTFTSLLKDLGQQIVIYDSTNVDCPHIAVMRKVMLVNGYDIEGISVMPPFSRNIYYICTWHDGSVANDTLYPIAPVARTG